MQRTYSTREVAQIWNVSESTVKRWSDSGDLACRRTPGGHRRFSLRDLRSFQSQRGFEATGVLKSSSGEDAEIESALNRKDFGRIRDQVFYLAVRNQCLTVQDLLERLYLRGLPLVELYDRVLLPVLNTSSQRLRKEELGGGHARIVATNLEEAMSYLFPQTIRRCPNGRIGLCATPDRKPSLWVKAVSRVLQSEGWECLNLGSSVNFSSMAEVVAAEPVNLVCLTSRGLTKKQSKKCSKKGFTKLVEITGTYRIPVILLGKGFDHNGMDRFGDSHCFSNLSSFQRFLVGLARH